VAKKEWGTKRQCLGCGARFYDLDRSNIVCPKCEAVFQPESLLKSKRWQASDNAAQAAAAKVAEKKPEAETEEDLVDDADDLDDDDDSNDTLLADDDDEDDGVASVVASKPSVEGSS